MTMENRSNSLPPGTPGTFTDRAAAWHWYDLTKELQFERDHYRNTLQAISDKDTCDLDPDVYAYAALNPE
jgi:hypothetical protein